MVRVNLIDVSLLTDQHLIAEHNEIRMIVSSYRRSLRTQTIDDVLGKVRDQFTLGPGHALYFFDKLEYLRKRHEQLREEGMKRGFVFNYELDLSQFDQRLFNDYAPTPRDIKIIVERIDQRIKLKPHWYRWRRTIGTNPAWDHFRDMVLQDQRQLKIDQHQLH